MNREHLEALAATLRQIKGHEMVKEGIVSTIILHEKGDDPNFERWFRTAADVPAPKRHHPGDAFASYY